MKCRNCGTITVLERGFLSEPDLEVCPACGKTHDVTDHSARLAQATAIYNQGLEKVASSPAPDAEPRDFTPEEALAEAERLWGPENSSVSGYIEYDPWLKKEFRCKVGRYYRLEEESDEIGTGATFREAFANAAKGEASH